MFAARSFSARVAAPVRARLSSTLTGAAPKVPSAAAAASTSSSANLTTAASSSSMGETAASSRHTVNLAGKVMSRSRMFATNASESLPGLSELSPAQARAQRAQHRMRDAKSLAGIL